jgi:hypothetical protein
MSKDNEWEYLLGLNGVEMFLDESLQYWVKFVVHRAPITSDSSHGITYSLTLHDKKGNRLLGFDNAHRIGKSKELDHWHRDHADAGRAYSLNSPNQLLADFWREVDRIVKESNDD